MKWLSYHPNFIRTAVAISSGRPRVSPMELKGSTLKIWNIIFHIFRLRTNFQVQWTLILSESLKKWVSRWQLSSWSIPSTCLSWFTQKRSGTELGIGDLPLQVKKVYTSEFPYLVSTLITDNSKENEERKEAAREAWKGRKWKTGGLPFNRDGIIL